MHLLFYFLDYNIAKYECLGKALRLDGFKNSRFQPMLVGFEFSVEFKSRFGSKSKN
jgi:hypothetical protein